MSISTLRSIDETKIVSPDIKAKLADAISLYDGLEDNDLKNTDKIAIDRIIAQVQKHIKAIEDSELARQEAEAKVKAREEQKAKEKADAEAKAIEEAKVKEEAQAKEKAELAAKAIAEAEAAEKALKEEEARKLQEQETKKRHQHMIENQKFPHQEYLEQHPEIANEKDVKDKIKGWYLGFKLWEKDPESEKLLNACMKGSDTVKKFMESKVEAMNSQKSAQEAEKMKADAAAAEKAKLECDAKAKEIEDQKAKEAQEAQAKLDAENAEKLKAETEAKAKEEAEAAAAAKKQRDGVYGNSFLKDIFGV